jgi:hypothetical protein
MKKNLLILFAFLTLSLPSFAVITPEEATSQTYMENHGYSNEMSRLMDLNTAQINSTKPKYVGTDPAWYGDKKVNFIRRAFMYFDCGLDDGKFMQNNIQYTTKYDDM